MQPLFSIIIPCYNHGAFLRRAIGSATATDIPVEVIIVDDGSTDPETIQELARLQSEGYQVIIQQNAGPGAARNTGIAASRGKYIVPLDSDDMVRADYLARAREVLNAQEEITVVYADYQFFGGREGVNKYRDFSLQDLLLYNSIGACVIYRKSAWEAVGGYDIEMARGYSWEDWDLWINFAHHHFRFLYLDMVGYDYFFHADSRERSFLKNKLRVNRIITYLENKYPGFYAPANIHNNLVHQLKSHPLGMLVKILAAAFFPRFYSRQVQKGRIRKYLV